MPYLSTKKFGILGKTLPEENIDLKWKFRSKFSKYFSFMEKSSNLAIRCIAWYFSNKEWKQHNTNQIILLMNQKIK